MFLTLMSLSIWRLGPMSSSASPTGAPAGTNSIPSTGQKLISTWPAATMTSRYLATESGFFTDLDISVTVMPLGPSFKLLMGKLLSTCDAIENPADISAMW